MLEEHIWHFNLINHLNISGLVFYHLMISLGIYHVSLRAFSEVQDTYPVRQKLLNWTIKNLSFHQLFAELKGQIMSVT